MSLQSLTLCFQQLWGFLSHQVSGAGTGSLGPKTARKNHRSGPLQTIIPNGRLVLVVFMLLLITPTSLSFLLFDVYIYTHTHMYIYIYIICCVFKYVYVMVRGRHVVWQNSSSVCVYMCIYIGECVSLAPGTCKLLVSSIPATFLPMGQIPKHP